MARGQQVSLMLHNVRSAYNVGSAFRTADAAGVGKVFLTGYTPAPVDQFARTNKEIAKTALGAEQGVHWEKVRDIGVLLKRLQKEGVTIIAVEQDKGATDYKSFHLRGQTAFLFGNEVRGLSQQLLNKAGRVIEIPMRGKKESLNISVAIGVVLFHVLDV